MTVVAGLLTATVLHEVGAVRQTTIAQQHFAARMLVSQPPQARAVVLGGWAYGEFLGRRREPGAPLIGALVSLPGPAGGLVAAEAIEMVREGVIPLLTAEGAAELNDYCDRLAAVVP